MNRNKEVQGRDAVKAGQNSSLPPTGALRNQLLSYLSQSHDLRMSASKN